MPTLRLSLTGTVILALLGGLGGVVLAQSEDEGGAVVTIESSTMLAEGAEPDLSFWYANEVEASDPRLSGTWTENWMCQFGSWPMACVGTVRVENEGGTWLGRVEGFSHPKGAHDWTVLEGQGGYAGLTALRLISERAGSEGIESVEEMAILDSELPAQPEPRLPPAE